MIFDAFAYFGHWPLWKLRVAGLQATLALMNRHGVDKALICSTKSVFLDWEAGNEEVFAACAESGGCLLPAVTVSPRAVNAEERLTEYVGRGARALWLFPNYHSYSVDAANRPLMNLMERAQQLGMTVFLPLRLIMNWGLPTLPMVTAAFIAHHFPYLRLVVAGFNYMEQEEVLDLAWQHQNLLVETSCLQGLNGVKRCVEVLGPERVLLGTGLPLQYPECGLVKVRKAKISEEARELVLGGNAQRLFG